MEVKKDCCIIDNSECNIWTQNRAEEVETKTGKEV